MIVKLDHFRNRFENKKYLEPPPSTESCLFNVGIFILVEKGALHLSYDIWWFQAI